MVADYVERLNNNFVQKPEDKFLHGVWEYERKGTLLPLMTDEEICEEIRQLRRQMYLK